MIFDEREVPLAMPNSLTKEFGIVLAKIFTQVTQQDWRLNSLHLFGLSVHKS